MPKILEAAACHAKNEKAGSWLLEWLLLGQLHAAAAPLFKRRLIASTVLGLTTPRRLPHALSAARLVNSGADPTKLLTFILGPPQADTDTSR
jgi:hypothetical protein